MATKKPLPEYRLKVPDFDLDAGLAYLSASQPAAAEPELGNRGVIRGIGDVALSAGRGAVQGVRMLTDLGGADNAASRGLRSVEDFIGSLRSAQAQQDDQKVAEIMRAAEGAGILDQVVAGARAFAVAPLSLGAQALGTSIPTLAAAAIPGVGPAAAAGRMGAALSIGAGQGAGSVKGAIYDEVKQELMKAGASEEEANRRALERSSYEQAGGKIATGAALGALAGTTGAERAVGAVLRGAPGAAQGVAKRVGMGAVAEGVPEFLQEGQEKLASNQALYEEGFDRDPMSGVFASGTMGLLAGAGMGAVAGIPRPAMSPGDQLRTEGLQPERGPATRALNAAVEAAAKKVDEGAAVVPPVDALGVPATEVTPEQALMRMEAQASADASRYGNATVDDWSRIPDAPAGGEPDWMAQARATALADQQAAQQEAEAQRVEQERQQRIAEIQAAPVDRAPRQRTPEAAPPTAPADLVTTYVDQRRNDGTPAGRAFAQDFDAGRITRAEVQGLIDAARPQSADERLAAAAAQAPQPMAPQPGDLLNPRGEPFRNQRAATTVAQREGGSVIVVDGGWAVRKREADGQPRGDEGTGTAERGAVSGDRSVVQQPADQRGSAGNAAPAVGGAEPGDGAAVVRPREDEPSPKLTADTDLATLKKAWSDAAAAGDTVRTKEINDLIVSKKRKAVDTSAQPVQEAPKGEQVVPGTSVAKPSGDMMPAGLSVTFGGKTYAVESVEDAQRKWIKFRDSADGGGPAGVSQVGNGIPITDGAGRLVARVSYNGRAFDPQDKLMAEPPVDRPAAAEVVPGTTPDDNSAVVMTTPSVSKPDKVVPGTTSEAPTKAKGSKKAAEIKAKRAAKVAAEPESKNSLADVYERTANAKYPGRDNRKTAEKMAAELSALIDAKNADGLIARNLGSADMNPASRAVFEAATGVTLPKGRAATEAAIDAWAGVTPEQRAEKQEQKRKSSEAKAANDAAEWAGKAASAIQVKMPDGNKTGREWVDDLIAAGYTRIVRRGPKTYLANSKGEGFAMLHKDIAEYARKKSATVPEAKTPAPAAPESAAATTEGARNGQEVQAQEEVKAEAPADVTTAGAAATHKDPGEPAEPVTPAVVEEAIKTAARNEERTRSEMKAEALRLIDAAIAKAPEKGAKKVTIDVPGDGKFTVVNTVDRLKAFRAEVEKSPGFSDRPTKAPTQSRTNNDGEFFGVQDGSGSAAASARKMLEEGEPANAVELLETAGKPMMFGNSPERPIPYTDGSPVEIAGVPDLFVGRGWSTKKGETSWWSVIHKGSGFAIGGSHSNKNEALAEAKKLLSQADKRARFEELVASGKSADGKPFKTQDKLRAEFMVWAEKYQQAQFDAGDAAQARIAEWNKKAAERFAIWKSIMGEEAGGIPGASAQKQWEPASIKEFLNKADKQGRVAEATKLIEDTTTEGSWDAWVAKTVKEWEKAAQSNELSIGYGVPLDLKKPPHTMTWDEVDASVRAWTHIPAATARAESALRPWKEAHFEAVKQAVERGWRVPDRVLYDYRGLVRSDLNDEDADIAADAMVTTYQQTKDYGKAVQAYRDWKPGLDLKGFERTQKTRDGFVIEDGDMTVLVNKTKTWDGKDRFQARLKNSTTSSGPNLTEQQAVDWAANLRTDMRKAAPEAAPSAAPVQQAEAAPVSSVAGQKNLAYRGSRIASLLAMNEQIRKLDPTEAWHPDNIKDATDLDALQDSISSTLVRLQREKDGAPKQAEAAPKMDGQRRESEKVNPLTAPYNNGDIVTIGGKDWMVKQDMPGWYLTSDGTWRGEHPTIKGIKGMTELIRAVDEAVDAAKPTKQAEAAKAAEPTYDAARAQELRNSIAEGELILRDGKNALGKKMTSAQLDVVRRSVESSKKKLADLGPDSTTMFSRASRKLEQERDLVIQHNLTVENLMHAARMGGIPVPSLAVTQADAPLVNFGEITLIGTQDMADPKGYAGTKVFGADIYSPRYPSVEFKLDNRAQRKMNEALAPFRKEGEREMYGGEIRRADDLTSYKPFKRWAADRYGVAEEATSWSQLTAAANALMRDIGAGQRIFQGFTYSGNRRYIDHTLDNVVKILKKELRGGENFNYGVGSLRAKFTPQFRSVDAIRKAKDRLVTKEAFEAIKKEVDSEFIALSNELDLSLEQTSEVIEDAAKMGAMRSLKRAFNDYRRGVDPLDEQAIAVGAFARKLESLPTAYFEAKILRAVDVAEFKAAVVPDDTPAEARAYLESRGVKVETYEAGNDTDRAAKIRAAANKHEALFSRTRGRGISMRDAKAVVSTIRSAMPNAPDIVLHESVDQAPETLRERIREEGAEDDVEAVYWNGEIHAFPGNLESVERAAFVIGRHEVRHHGMRTRYGKKLDEVLMAMWRGNQSLRQATQAIMDAGRARPSERTKAIEEALADLPVAEIAKLKGFDRFVAAIRDWLRMTAKRLRAGGFETLADAIEPKTWTDADVAAFVLKSEQVSGSGGTGGAFSRMMDVTNTPAFKRWFGDSKVVDADGKPLVVYHGTGNDFSTFMPSDGGEYGAGIYMTPDAKGASDYARYRGRTAPNVMPLYVSIQNPAGPSEANNIASWRGEEAVRPELIRRGYDGIIDKFSGQIIAFRPEQIKSAISNSTFDPNNPDIRLSRRPDTMAPAVTIDRDADTGAPVYATDDITIGFPQKTERFEYLGGQNLINYNIGPADGFGSYGMVELEIGPDGVPTGLADIEVKNEYRGQNIGAKVVEAILAAHPGLDLNISNIVEGARGFWDRMGIPEQNRASGEAYDGTLNWQTFSQAQNHRRANRPAPGRGAAGETRNARAEGGDPGAAGQAQGQVGSALFSRADIGRRDFLMGVAATLASSPASAELTIGKAKPISAADLSAKVTPAAEKLLRGNGATNIEGAKALKAAIAEIAANGPQSIRALAAEVGKLLPNDRLMLTVNDTRRVNAHGVVEFSTLPHMTLFTAEGRQGLSNSTVLHEALHAAVLARYQTLSTAVIRSNDSKLKMDAPAAAAALEQFRTVWDEFRQATRGEKFADEQLELAIDQARGSPDEFFVRTMTDPKLQSWMATKEYKGQTLLERFKDWIKSTLFGFSKSGTAPSWLDAALLASSDLNAAMVKDNPDFKRLAAINNFSSQRSAMFSRAAGLDPWKVSAQDLVNSTGGVFDFNRLGETQQDRVRTTVDGSRPFWLGALTRDQLADVYGAEIPQVKEYDTLTRAMENERQRRAQDADALYQEWAKIRPAANLTLSRTMADATLYSVHPDGDFPSAVAGADAEGGWKRWIEARKDTVPFAASVLENVSKKQGATKAQIEAVQKLMAEESGRRQVHARISRDFEALPPDAKAIYAKVKEFHLNTLRDLQQSLIDRIERQVEAGAARQAALTDIRQRFDKYLENGPYFPLSRFGDFLVVGTRESDGERVVAAYETAGEQQAAARRLEDDGFRVKMKTAKTYSRAEDGSAGKFIGDVLNSINSLDMDDAKLAGSAQNLKDSLLDDINQLFIRALPDLSYRKHFAHRKGTPGFSSDMMRGFASSAFHSASHLARLNHGDKMTFALRDAYTAIENAPEGDFNKHTQVLNELTKRHDAALNPNTHPIASFLNSLGFTMYLGLSPAAGLINLLQVPMVALPHIGARYGFGRASAAMGKAYKDIMGAPMNKSNGFNAAESLKLTPQERAAISALQSEGIIDLTQAHDLASATGLDTGNVARSKAAFAMARAMKIVGWTFHVPEVMNRQVTALTAYRLEMAKSGNEDAAMDAAREAIKRTQFDYSASNRARYMQGNLARVVTQFKQYSQNMTYLLARAMQQALKGETPEVRSIARRQLVATLGITFAMAGSLGLPGLGMLGGLIAMAANGLGDDDEPWDWKVEFRNLMADTFGKEMGEVISHGVPRALMPWDLASRVGLGDMWFRDGGRVGDNPREAFAADIAAILGPTAGTLLGWYTASDHMARGQYGKAAEAIVPKFIRDPLKAWREGSDGVTSYSGEPLMDLTSPEAVGRLLGFAPARASEMYAARNAVMNAKTTIDDKRKALLGQAVKARMDGDNARYNEVQNTIVEWNRRNPEARITPLQIRQSVMNKQRNRQNTENGITLPRTRENLRDIGRFASVE